MKFPKSQQRHHYHHSEPAPDTYFLVDRQNSFYKVLDSWYFRSNSGPQYCFLCEVKSLMFTRGLNKFYCGSLCDTFKIISPTKTWYQTGEKVAQIQGQDDKFSAKSCQISGVGRIYFNWNKTGQVVLGLEKISANLHCSLSLSDPLPW